MNSRGMTVHFLSQSGANVYIDNLRSRRFEKELLEIKLVVCCSAVVLREIHFDVLIAMTARRIGAYFITSDADDFTAIRQNIDFNLICW
jgi:hypothetical protein